MHSTQSVDNSTLSYTRSLGKLWQCPKIWYCACVGGYNVNMININRPAETIHRT